MGPENVAEFALAKEGGPPYEEYMEAAGDALAGLTADNVGDMLGGLFSETDREALANDAVRADVRRVHGLRIRGRLAGLLRRQRGRDHARGDLTSLTSTSACTSSTVTPTLWCRQPTAMWLAGHIPGVVTHHRPNEGHVSIYTEHFDELADVLTDLSA